MGVDMYALSPRKGACHDFRINWSGMAKLADEMEFANVLDTITPQGDWPKRPPESEFVWLDERNEFGEYETAATEVGRAYLETLHVHTFRLGEHGRVPVWKFGSNDGWGVTIPECEWIADALEARVLLLDEGRWREIVEEFVTFNRLCAEKASGYVVW